jgi:hypothetical protein
MQAQSLPDQLAGTEPSVYTDPVPCNGNPIDPTNLSPGLYLLQTSKNGKTYSLKFTKQ